MIDVTQLKRDIARVMGDQQDQYSVEIDTELKLAVLELTTYFKFYWNIERQSGLTHTNGKINLPQRVASIELLYDNSGNLFYVGADAARFYPVLDGFTTFGQHRKRANEIYMLRNIDKTTGVEYLLLDSGEDTPSDKTFNLVYSRYYEQVEPWMPDRLYAYFLGYVVSKMLNRVDSPDTELLRYYTSMMTEARKYEIGFGQNSAFITYNNKAVSDLIAVQSNSYGI